ncbi:MAG TPA: hypothetical protein VGH44_06460 [Candidatus Saccharimonadia bacterium]
MLEPVGATQFAGLTPDWPTVDITYSSFVSNIHARLFDATSVVNEGRVASIVDIMLGKNGPDFGGSHVTGIQYAQDHWADWVALVAAYNSGAYPGYSVNFNVFQDFTGQDVNGWGVITNNVILLSCAPPEQCQPDVAFAKDSEDPEVDKSVIFYYPGGKFLLKDKCGNLTGDVTAPPMPPTPKLQLSKSSDQVGVTAVGNDIVYSITGLESIPIQLTSVTITDTLPAQMSYVGPAPGAPTPTYSPATKTLTWSFSLPANAAILDSWTTGPPQPLRIIVKATGLGIGVNTATGVATNTLGPVLVLPGSTTNNVMGVVVPIVTGQNSDIHAGSGLACSLASGGGNVIGNIRGTTLSSGQYVVSATGLIGGFNSSGGTNLLTLGANGGYGQICRPDLLSLARAYSGSDIKTIPTAGAVTGWSVNGQSGLYYFYGSGELDISGTVSNRITLVALNASRVVINGNIVLNPGSGTGRSDIPSLGIIADQNLDILSSVNEVDAYLFTDGTINTCGKAATPDAPCGIVTPTLNVKGFLMAHDLLLSRLGPPAISGSVEAEVVAMNPQLYLNPPKLFDSSADQSLYQGLGELPPLF